MTFKDLFSEGAAEYARHRPSYPKELFDFLANLSPHRNLAWDCATGTGQAAKGLAPYFKKVVATDLSADQLRQADVEPQIEYREAAADRSTLAADSVDLITVGQALHWLPLETFYTEVRRVARTTGSYIAAWSYHLVQITPEIDRAVEHFYRNDIGRFWEPERHFVEERYATIPFPFQPVAAPSFVMKTSWTGNQLLDYIGTWSATREARRILGSDPLEDLRLSLGSVWGDLATPRKALWPLALRVGAVHP